MKVKNTTEKTINLYIKKVWKTIEPNMAADIPSHIVKNNEGLEEIKPVKKVVKKKVVK